MRKLANNIAEKAGLVLPVALNKASVSGNYMEVLAKESMLQKRIKFKSNTMARNSLSIIDTQMKSPDKESQCSMEPSPEKKIHRVFLGELNQKQFKPSKRNMVKEEKLDLSSIKSSKP